MHVEMERGNAVHTSRPRAVQSGTFLLMCGGLEQ